MLLMPILIINWVTTRLYLIQSKHLNQNLKEKFYQNLIQNLLMNSVKINQLKMKYLIMLHTRSSMEKFQADKSYVIALRILEKSQE
ncbi:hypothetical protein DFR34_10897 [Rivihabitans pingtungensis]|uniref:Uncharacterized protein n=1 Tax=Rivihabitans pingtungensis TaxID=1054498 RepID=A0A318KU29_9NEIS|nr:hypothetical protein DFR34_10897 [Rivihabitans pingtungensis]